MNATQESTTKKQSRASAADKAIIDLWSQIPDTYSEKDLAANFIPFMFRI
jgi:hypothetical protein